MSAVAKRLAPEDLSDSRHRTSRLALYALAAYGRVPGYTLDSGPIQLLLMLLANGPVVHIRRRKLGARLGVSLRTVSAYAERLSAIVLGGVPLLRRHQAGVPLHGVYPWKPDGNRNDRANLQSYELAVEELLAAIEAGQRQERADEAAERERRYRLSGAVPDRRPSRPSQRQPCGSSQGPFKVKENLNQTPPQETPPEAAGPLATETDTGVRAPTPPASHGVAAAPPGGIVADRAQASDLPSESPAAAPDAPASSPDAAPLPTARNADARAPEAPTESESDEGKEQVSGRVEAVAAPSRSDVEACAQELSAEWNALGIVESSGQKSRGADAYRVIVARLRAGYTAEALRAVMLAASADVWLARRRVDFAPGFVFDVRDNPDGRRIDRFAHLGRKMRGAQDFAAAVKRRTAPTPDAPGGRVDGKALSELLASTLNLLGPKGPPK